MNVRQFKLANGEEILCDVIEWPTAEDEHSGVVIKNSFKIMVSISPPPETARYFQLYPWMIMQDDNEYYQVINADLILAEAAPSPNLLTLFKKAVEADPEDPSEPENIFQDDFDDLDAWEDIFTKKTVH